VSLIFRFELTMSTIDYLSAVAALKNLPLEKHSAVFRVAAKLDLQEIATTRYGKPIDNKSSWKRFIGQSGEGLPSDDHTELRRLGDVLTYVSHPYGLRLKDLRAIVQACDERELNLLIDAGSWYSPTRTLAVIYQTRPSSLGQFPQWTPLQPE
jgi:hypothetical protein